MARSCLVESLESRRLLSATTLLAAESALSVAVNQLSSDQTMAAQVITADKAKVAQDRKAHSENLAAELASLRTKLNQDEQARSSTLATDRSNLKIAISNDKIIITGVKNDIRIDKMQKNKAQLQVDRAQLVKDQFALQKDRNSLNIILQNDIITAASSINQDQQAIAAAIRGTGDVTLANDKQTLSSDQKTWTDTLANDRKAVSKARLAVARARHS